MIGPTVIAWPAEATSPTLDRRNKVHLRAAPMIRVPRWTVSQSSDRRPWRRWSKGQRRIEWSSGWCPRFEATDWAIADGGGSAGKTVVAETLVAGRERPKK